MDKIDPLILLGSAWAAIASLFFAVFTYWADVVRRWCFQKQLKKQVCIELRSLYFGTIIPDILEYDKAAESNFSKKFCGKKYELEILRSLSAETKFKLFRSQDSLARVSLLLSLVKDKDREWFSFSTSNPIPNRKDFFNFLFEHRILEIRNHVTALSWNTSFLDLSIIPKERLGWSFPRPFSKDKKVRNRLFRQGVLDRLAESEHFSQLSNDLEKYKNIQKDHLLSCEIIKKHFPDFSLWNIPEQYFGE